MQTTGQTEPQAGAPKKRKAPKTAYKPGQSGNPTGKPKPRPVPDPPVELPVIEGETELEAMRCVFLTSVPKTKQQWQMHQLLLGSREKFLDRKMVLEKIAGQTSDSTSARPSADSSPSSLPTSTPPVDLGAEACLELARGLLEKYRPKP
jgi:hypothetical protein